MSLLELVLFFFLQISAECIQKKDESPGKIVETKGKKYKTIRGMGSRSAMEQRSGSRGRYYQQKQDEHTAEELTNEQKGLHHHILKIFYHMI